MNIIYIEENTNETISLNADFPKVLGEVLHKAVEIVGKEYFVAAICSPLEELQLAA